MSNPLAAFTIRVPQACYRADQKTFYYEVSAERDGNHDTVLRRFNEFKALHQDLVKQFKHVPRCPVFGQSLKTLPMTRAKPHGMIPEYVRRRQEAFDAFLLILSKDAAICSSYVFQQFLPKSCRIHFATNPGLQIRATEHKGAFRSKAVSIHVDPSLQIIRIAPLKRPQTLKEIISVNDILDLDMDSKALQCRLELLGGDRQFSFETHHNLVLFCDLVAAMNRDRFRHRLSGTSDLPLFPQATARRSLATLPRPARQLRLYAVSWNMARQDHTALAEHVLPYGGDDYDVVVLGLQECRSFFGNSRRPEKPLEEHVQSFLGKAFRCIVSKRLWELVLLIFVRSSVQAKAVASTSVATGFMNVIGNKGAIAASLSVLDTPLCFVNAHLAPHQHASDSRNLMFQEIVRDARLGDPFIDLVHQFDAVFWVGDLNYRLDLDAIEANRLARAGLYDDLLPHDQLIRAMATAGVFSGFQEGKILFAPTYKFILGKEEDIDLESDSEEEWDQIQEIAAFRDPIKLDPPQTPKKRLLRVFSIRKSQVDDEEEVEGKEEAEERGVQPDSPQTRLYHLKRVPSYTDRILWRRNARDLAIEQLFYTVCDSATKSDHLPVSAAFAVTPADPIPPEAYEGHTLVQVSSIEVTFDTTPWPDQTHVYVLFHGSCLTESVYTSRQPIPSSSSCTLHWTESSLPSLDVALQTSEAVSGCRVLLSVCRGDAAPTDPACVLLQTSVPLAPRRSLAAWSFSLPLARHGLRHGAVTGSLAAAAPAAAVVPAAE